MNKIGLPVHFEIAFSFHGRYYEPSIPFQLGYFFFAPWKMLDDVLDLGLVYWVVSEYLCRNCFSPIDLKFKRSLTCCSVASLCVCWFHCFYHPLKRVSVFFIANICAWIFNSHFLSLGLDENGDVIVGYCCIDS